MHLDQDKDQDKRKRSDSVLWHKKRHQKTLITQRICLKFNKFVAIFGQNANPSKNLFTEFLDLDHYNPTLFPLTK